jgi:hypothetical protein
MLKVASPVLAAILALAAASAARADILTISLSGTFDDAPTLASGSNVATGAVGQSYSMSASVSTDNYLLNRSQVDLTQNPPNQEAWFFATNSTFRGAAGGWNVGLGGVVANVTNDFYYDGSNGVDPAGYYDELTLTGYALGGPSFPKLDAVACDNGQGDSLLGSVDGPPGPCSIQGLNYAVNIDLIGKSGFIAGIGANPFGSLDFSQVIYGSTEFWVQNDGVLIGSVGQDPPLTYDDGVLSGPGMTATFALTPAPEPGTWALLVLGLGSVGCGLRRRRAFDAPLGAPTAA